MLDPITHKRIQQKELELEAQLDKLHEFNMDLTRAVGAEERNSIKQTIKFEIIPALSKINKQYASLISQIEFSEPEAEPLVSELISISKNPPEAYKDEFKIQLQNLYEGLSDQSKSASAKLKVALPLVPGLVNYELELDTENFFSEMWTKVRGLLTKKV